jgi:hypothetical protein
MARTQAYGGRDYQRMRAAKDTETIVGNSLATLVAIGAGALALIGLLVGFGVIDTDNAFNNGILWLAASLTTALCANVFRREHHIIDEDEVKTGMMGGGGEYGSREVGSRDVGGRDVGMRERER